MDTHPLDPQATRVLPRLKLSRPLERWIDRRYEIIDEIGGDGNTRVYRAWDHGLQHVVTVKVLEATVPDQAREAFVREATFLAGLPAHPNVVGVHEAHDGPAVAYAVMQFVDGEPLQALVDREAPLADVQTFRLGRQIAQALHFAHHYGLVHGHVTADNVLLTRTGQPRVINFGGMQVGRQGRDEGAMAPECRAGGAITPPADVFGLGALLYYMLTGVRADTGRGALDPRDVQPEIPDEAARIVRRALQPNPADRYATAGALSAALNTYLTAHRRPGPVVLDPAGDTPTAGHTAVMPRLPEQSQAHARAVPVERAPRQLPRPRIGWSSSLFVLAFLIAAGGGWFAYTLVNAMLAGWHSGGGGVTPLPAKRHTTAHVAAGAGPAKPATCAPATSGDVELTRVWTQNTHPAAGAPTVFEYTLVNHASSCRSVALQLGLYDSATGAALSGLTGAAVTVRTGTQTVSRTFAFPAGSAGKTYSVAWTVTGAKGRTVLGTMRANGLITVG